MKKQIITILSTLITAVILMSSSGGISNANGAPSETTCNTSGCHTGNTLNSSSGSISITDNIPTSGYIPGATYNISVTIARNGTSLFGFGFESVSSSNTTAGTLVVVNSAQTRTLNGIRVNMTHQTNAGLSANSKTFTFNWIAPATPAGNITFYAAGNAANQNGNTSGDFIFTTTKVFGSSPVITGIINGSPFCGGASGISIPYIASGTFGGGNVFTAEISDASGSFASPVTLGSVATTTSGTIISTLPLPLVAGTGYRIRVNSSNPVFTGIPNLVNLNIIAPPSIANAGPNQNICGNSTTLSANQPTTGTGVWTLLSGTGNISSTSNPSASVSGLSTGANVFRWTISSSGCSSSISNVTLTSVSPPSTASASADQTVCADFVNLTANTPSSGTGTWVLVSGAGSITSASNPSTSVTSLSTGLNVFAWVISNAPCSLSSDTVNVSFNGTITIANAGIDQTVCANSATLNANVATAGTGSWSVISGSGNFASALNPQTSVNNLALGNNVFRWVISNGACTPTTDDVTITSNSVSTANAGPATTLCVIGTTLQANNPVFGIGTWSILAGTAIMQNINSYSTQVANLSPGANIFEWTITNATCAASSSTVIITQSGTMSTSDAGLDQTICSTSLNLSPGAVFSGTGNWTLISGSGFIANSSSPNTAITAIGTGTNVFRWTVSNGTCTPSFDDVAIIVNTITTANAGTMQTICSNSCILNANNPVNGVGQWTLLSGTGVITTTQNAVTTVNGLGTGVNVFRWTISNSPCLNSVSNVTVNNCNNNAINTNAIIGSPFCNSTSYQLMVAFTSTGTFNGFYTAELSDPFGSFASPLAIGSGPGSPISAIIPASVSTGTAYRVRVKNSSPVIFGTDNGTDLSINTCDVNYITVDTIHGSPFCQETSYNLAVSFVLGGTVNPAFVAELSDLTGSFANPITIGYSSASPIIASIPLGTPTGFNYRIRVRNSTGVFSSLNKSPIAINTCGITLLDENSLSDFIQIYPSLSDGLIHVQSSKYLEGVKIEILDILGTVVAEKEMQQLSSHSDILFNIQEKEAGMYIVRISTNKGSLQRKIIKY